jgi:acetyl-CoA synthetase
MSEQYTDLYDSYRWHVPRGFNLAQTCCFSWAALPSHERRAALIHQSASGQSEQITFKDLAALTAQLANGLVRLGAIPGDRIAIIMGANPIQTMALLLACWSMQAIAVPLAPRSSTDALVSRLRQARCQIAFIDAQAQTAALEAIARCTRIQQVVGLDVVAGNVLAWRGLIARQATSFTPGVTTPSAPALLVWPGHASIHFPDNTAMLLPHQALVGNLPGFVAANHWFPDNANRLLTTLEPWQEAGLLGAILPALYFGHTVVLDASQQLAACTSEVTHIVAPTAHLCHWLKTAARDASEALPQPLSVCAIGHHLSPANREALQARLGVEPNLALFITGSGLVCAENQTRWPGDPQGCGRVIPGHQLKIIPDETGVFTAPLGQLAIARVDQQGHTDPSQYVQIWLQKEPADGAVTYELPAWFLPGLVAKVLPDQHLEVLGRAEDVLVIEQHRVSCAALEQPLMMHPDVEAVAVVPSPLKKPLHPTRELWILVKPTKSVNSDDPLWQSDLTERLQGLILELLPKGLGSINLRVGLVTDIPTDDLGNPAGQAWASRNRAAEIQFIGIRPSTNASHSSNASNASNAHNPNSATSNPGHSIHPN